MDLAFIVLLTLASVALLWRSTVAFALVVVLQQIFREIGLVTLAQNGQAEYETAWLYLGGTIALVVGYVASEFVLRNRPARAHARLNPLPDSAVWAIVLVAGALGLYHLFATGLPIFSSNIETERFDFTSSGFFGVPGRMYLFGINIAWIVAAANARANDMRWRDYGPWKWATGALLVSTILSGFKGDLFSLVLTFFALYTIISGTRMTLGRVIKRYWWAGLAGVGYFAVVAALYPTYANNEQNIFTQLFTRLTTVPAQAVQYAMEGRWYFPEPIPVLSDFRFFLLKYTGNEIPGSYSFERSVSAAIIGADPSSNAWTTPVTIGAFAEILVSFGFVAALAMMFVAGIVLSRGESGRIGSTQGLVLRAILGLFMFNWLVKGGFAYYLLNLGAVTAMLTLVGVAAWMLSYRRNPAREKRFNGELVRSR